MNLSVKNVKVRAGLSEETLCFEATLYRDGKRIATVSNRGTGGPHAYCFINQDVCREVNDWAQVQPVTIKSPDPALPDFEPLEKLDYFVDTCVANVLRIRDLTKLCRKGIAYRLKDQKVDQWWVTETQYTAEAAQRLRDQHGDKLEAIAQELIAELSLPKQRVLS
jgi:hypothetical protein